MQSYHHFTLKERFCIAENLELGKSIRSIAKTLNRNPSSVSREINKNIDSKGHYDCIEADNNYAKNKKKSKKKIKLLNDEQLYEFVYKCLKKFWSPEIISIAAKKLKMIISVKSIYEAIKNGLFPGITATTHLRRRGKKYCYGGRNKYNTIQPEHTIHERPVSADNRSRFGHWEGDTILGGVGKGCIVTLIERKSRFVIAKKANSKSQKDVGEALIEAFREMHVKLDIKSITLIYFADPHSPWQRGSNENINDVFRFFYPKGIDFRFIKDSDIQQVVDLINNRPRKCLGNLSPYEYLKKYKKVLHLD